MQTYSNAIQEEAIGPQRYGHLDRGKCDAHPDAAPTAALSASPSSKQRLARSITQQRLCLSAEGSQALWLTAVLDKVSRRWRQLILEG